MEKKGRIMAVLYRSWKEKEYLFRNPVYVWSQIIKGVDMWPRNQGDLVSVIG